MPPATGCMRVMASREMRDAGRFEKRISLIEYTGAGWTSFLCLDTRTRSMHRVRGCDAELEDVSAEHDIRFLVVDDDVYSDPSNYTDMQSVKSRRWKSATVRIQMRENSGHGCTFH